MNKIRSLLGTLGACLVLALAAPACVTDGGADTASELADEAGITVVTISARSFDDLAPGEVLLVDSRDKSKVFRFDPSQGPIDFSRIELICPNGQKMRMDEWLAHQAGEGLDVDRATSQGFSVGGDQQVSNAYVDLVESAGEPGYGPQLVQTVCDCWIFICGDGVVVVVCSCA